MQGINVYPKLKVQMLILERMTRSIELKRDQLKSNYSGEKKYDLVIIGCGLTGLSSALMWQKNTENKRTLVIEQHSYPGGYSTSYERDGYVFETTQLFPDIVDILDYLEVDVKLKQYKGDFMRRLVVDGDQVDEYKIPAGVENYTNYLVSKFPEDEKKIRALMKYGQEMFKQVRKLKSQSTTLDKLKIPFQAPRVLANLNRTYSELLDKFELTNPKLREVMETFTSFSGVPSDRASAIYTFGGMISSMTRCFRPYGYFDEYPAKMAELFQERGGEILFNTEVEKIVVENGTATGVTIKGGDEVISAGTVITTVDVNLAMRKLVGVEHLPASYVEKLDKVVMSVSSINVSLGLDDKIDMSKLDLDYPYNVISTGLGTTEALFEGFLAGDHAFSEKQFHMAVICPSLTTGAKNTITLRCTPFALNQWKEWRENDYPRYKQEKEKWGDFFIGLAEKYVIPNLSKHIVVKDISTPATYARYSGSPTGSIYGMASLVSQFGPKRLPMKTPIKNLYQPKFAHALYGTMMNGVQVVDILLDRKFNNGNSLFAPVNR